MLNGADKIEGLTPEQLEQINNLAGGLNNKNQELLDKLNANKSSGEQHAAELERLRLLETNLARTKEEEKENYQGALTLKEQEHKEALEKIANENSGKDTIIHKLLVENGLNTELIRLNVNTDLLPMIEAGLAAKAKIIDGKAMIGEQSLSEYCNEWAETPAGKAARLATNNSGGDASGGGSGGEQGKAFKDMTLTERTQLANSDPDKFNELSNR